MKQDIYWYQVDNEIMKGKIDATVLIMGNSRAMGHIIPSLLDSLSGTRSYNFGMDSYNIKYQYDRYSYYRDCCKSKPKVIIQNVDYWTMRDNPFKSQTFLPYFWDVRFRKHIPSCYGIADRFVPMFRYMGNYNAIAPALFGEKVKDPLYNGYYPNPAEFNAASLHKWDSLGFIVSPDNDSLLREYLETAEEDSIQVVFVYAPLFHQLADLLPDLDGMFSYYSTIAEKYDIPVFDYTFADITTDSSYFFNANHLNPKGAQWYTARLSEDLRPFLENRE